MSAPPISQSQRLLVVDDEAAVCQILTSLLKKRGFQVVVANSCAETLEILDSEKFDAWIFDWKLLDGNGLDLAAQLRERGDETPIIFVTGFANTDLALNAAGLGIKDLLSKPFSSTDLYAAVDRALEDEPAGQEVTRDSPADSLHASGQETHKKTPEKVSESRPGKPRSGWNWPVINALLLAALLLIAGLILTLLILNL